MDVEMKADFYVHHFLCETEAGAVESLCLGHQGQQLYFGPTKDAPAFSCEKIAIIVDGQGATYCPPKAFSWPEAWEELDFVKRMEKCQWIVQQGFTHVDYAGRGDTALRDRVHEHHPLLRGRADHVPLTFSLESGADVTLVVIDGLIVYGRDACKQ